MPTCKCKVGGCPDCDSDCRRCGCACDGVDPSVAASRGRGRPAGRAPRKSKATGARRGRPRLERPQTQIDDVATLWFGHGLSQPTFRQLPSKRSRDEGTVDEGSRGFAAMAAGLSKIVRRSAELLYPGGSNVLTQRLSAKLCKPVEKYTTKDVEKIGDFLASVYKKGAKASIQKRVVRAVLLKGFRGAVRKQIETRNDFRVWTTSSQAYNDAAALEAGDTLAHNSRTNTRYSEEGVQTAVRFILRPSNVGTLSWGTELVKVGTDIIELPKVVRRKSCKALYDAYVKHCNTHLVQSAFRYGVLGRSSFHSIVQTLTSGDFKLLRGVDHVTSSTLVDSSVNSLQELVDTFTSGAESRELTTDIELMRNFLKVQYAKHIVRDDDEVSTHGLSYALSPSRPGQDADVRNEQCNGCKYVPHVLDRVREAILTAQSGEETCCTPTKDVLQSLDDIGEKLALYMGHIARAVNQQREIASVVQDMERACIEHNDSSTALVVVDWNMKFEGASEREKKQQHYGKRGLAWHGCMISFFKQVAGAETSDASAERVNVYVDQITEGGMMRGVWSAAGMLEACLHFIEKNLPNVEKVILQSDDASCYSCHTMRLMCCLLNLRSKVKIVRHISTETHDGQGSIDAHFARAMAHIIRFMRTARRKRIRAIATPAGVAHALAWEGGVRNSAVQLVRMDAARITQLTALTKRVVALLKRRVARVSDVQFAPCPNDDPFVDVRDLRLQKGGQRRFVMTMAQHAKRDAFRVEITFGLTVGEHGVNAKPVCKVQGADVDDDDYVDDDDDDDDDVQAGSNDSSGASADYFTNTDSVSAEQCIVVDFNGLEDHEDVVNRGEDSTHSDSDDDHLTAKDYKHQYGATTERPVFLLRCTILKQSNLVMCDRRVRRRHAHKIRGKPTVRNKVVPNTVVACAVRRAVNVVKDYAITDGQATCAECYDAAARINVPAKPRGWARRPKHGPVFGAK